MDWIEQIFGIDPDMSSGALEILIVGAIVVVIVGIVLSRRRTSATEEKVR